jgi:hypothetical protein
MSSLNSLITFPFESGGVYTLGQLRRFERELLAVRQRNRDLSAEWRVPHTGEMKRWAKIREETYPIMLLSDHLSYSDDTIFRLKPFGHPNIDAEIKSSGESYCLQITIADPIWVDGAGNSQNGGYDHRLSMEALNRFGVVHGSALMRRENGRIISGMPVRSFDEEFHACRQGLVEALKRKLSRGVAGGRLLIYARGYSMHTIDFTFEDVASSAVEQVQLQIDSSRFDVHYFVDGKKDEFFAYSKPKNLE